MAHAGHLQMRSKHCFPIPYAIGHTLIATFTGILPCSFFQEQRHAERRRTLPKRTRNNAGEHGKVSGVRAEG